MPRGTRLRPARPVGHCGGSGDVEPPRGIYAPKLSAFCGSISAMAVVSAV
jgi:hypothetical protein